MPDVQETQAASTLNDFKREICCIDRDYRIAAGAVTRTVPNDEMLCNLSLGREALIAMNQIETFLDSEHDDDA